MKHDQQRQDREDQILKQKKLAMAEKQKLEELKTHCHIQAVEDHTKARTKYWDEHD